MIEVRLNLLPQGDFRCPQGIGLLQIYNDETGTETHGNYVATMLSDTRAVLCRWRVTGLPRNASPWTLVSSMLAAKEEFRGR